MKECHHSFRKERVNVHIKKYKINNEYTQHLAALVWPEWSSFWLKLFKSASDSSVLWPCTRSTGPQEGGAAVQLATSAFGFRLPEKIIINDFHYWLKLVFFLCTIFCDKLALECSQMAPCEECLTQLGSKIQMLDDANTTETKRPGFAVGKVLSSSRRKGTHNWYTTSRWCSRKQKSRIVYNATL